MIKRMVYVLSVLLYFVSVSLLTISFVLISPITFIFLNRTLEDNLELVCEAKELIENKIESLIEKN